MNTLGATKCKDLVLAILRLLVKRPDLCQASTFNRNQLTNGQMDTPKTEGTVTAICFDEVQAILSKMVKRFCLFLANT